MWAGHISVFPMTLSDISGDSYTAHLCIWYFWYSCTAAEKISSDSASHGPLR